MEKQEKILKNSINRELLQEYARLVVRVGVNLQKEQLLIINSPVETAFFARLLAKEAYLSGARDVTIVWNDEEFTRLRFELASKKVFKEYPNWKKELYTDNVQKGAAVISIAAETPELLKDIDLERITISQQVAGNALKEYRERMMSNKNAWCVISIPTKAWARKVFPNVSDEEAIQCLWEKILEIVRVNGDGLAEEKWKKHTAFLKRAADFLNRNQFKELHYKNALGTDLTVGLPDGHIWAGGAEFTQNNTCFVANMPTEEVYTMPHLAKVEGRVYSSKPLVYNGNLIEDFYFDFKEGKVVSFAAKKGEEALKELLAIDEGAMRLGEVALVSYNSPISKSGTLFYNTLFDENAACHFALGKAYPTCITGGESMGLDELKKLGVNHSLVHEDFMIGTIDLSIDGKDKEGNSVPIFRNGNFVAF